MVRIGGNMFVDNLYVKSELGKYIKVVFIAASDQTANNFMLANPGYGVIADVAVGPMIFIADNKDLGEKA